MSIFCIATLVSIGCPGQSCLRDSGKLGFGPATSGKVPKTTSKYGYLKLPEFQSFTHFLNKMINSCKVKPQQRHLEDINEKLVHSMPITMQCGGKPQNNLYLEVVFGY